MTGPFPEGLHPWNRSQTVPGRGRPGPETQLGPFLHSIFIDMQKFYVALGRYCCLDILMGYGVGPRTICLLHTYWARLQMTVKVGGHYGPVFHIHRGLNQGGVCHP